MASNDSSPISPRQSGGRLRLAELDRWSLKSYGSERFPSLLAVIERRVMKTRLTIFLLVLSLVVSTGCQPGGPDDGGPARSGAIDETVTVFAAASTTNAMDEVKAAFTAGNGVEVQANYAASSTLAQQIVNGADPDVFLSANVGWADYVESSATVESRRNLLSNRLVVIVPIDSKLGLEKVGDLVDGKVQYVALGDPEAVPAGKYAKQALVKLGLWEKLKGKVAAAKDVRNALTYVETGAAEAGIVYATDAAVSDKVRVVAEIPAELTEPVLYPVVLLKRGAENESARAFYDYLGGPEAGKIFEKFGFVVLE